MINVRQKGATGEREVIDQLMLIVWRVKTELGIPFTYTNPDLQRNQNQSAVGGSDITNPFGIAFEVKRQEQLAVNTWWAQCCKAAQADNAIPVLLYRQNGKKWHVVMLGQLPIPHGDSLHSNVILRVEISWEDFQQWFEHWIRRKLA